MEISRYDVFLATLDPAAGRAIRKTRPCAVVSPDEMNRHVGTVIVAPMTTKERKYPTRLDCSFQGRSGQVVLDQIRTVDKSRLIKKLGRLTPATSDRLSDVLVEMFER